MAVAPEDFAIQVAQLELFDEGDISLLAQYLYEEYSGQRDDLAALYYQQLLDQIRGQASQEILDIAAGLADTAADSLVKTIAATDLALIGEKIAQGIAEGLNPKDIARRLEEVQGLDSNRAAAFEKFREGLNTSDMTDAQIAAAEEREFQRLLRERRETIANTEAARAVSEGDFLEAKRVGAKYKIWQTTGDARVSDECQACEAQGPISIDDSFTSGADTPPNHPNCRCSVSYLDNAEQLPFARDFQKEAAAKTAAAKEGEPDE